MVNQKDNKPGDHKDQKSPNYLQIVMSKRRKLIKLYKQIYIKQSGLSYRAPGYNKNAGFDRVKALEMDWPKSLHQRVQLYDNAITEANLELGQVGLPAGAAAGAAAAVDVAPAELAEVADVNRCSP